MTDVITAELIRAGIYSVHHHSGSRCDRAKARISLQVWEKYHLLDEHMIAAILAKFPDADTCPDYWPEEMGEFPPLPVHRLISSGLDGNGTYQAACSCGDWAVNGYSSQQSVFAAAAQHMERSGTDVAALEVTW